jgi:hypothetical protein
MFSGMQCIAVLLLIFVSFSAVAFNNPAIAIFGYKESPRSNLDLFLQWLSVLGRHFHNMRVVVVQDTNQKIAHAVMSIGRLNDAGLTAENIMQEVKIISVTSAFVAMSSARTYRRGAAC